MQTTLTLVMICDVIWTCHYMQIDTLNDVIECAWGDLEENHAPIDIDDDDPLMHMSFWNSIYEDVMDDDTHVTFGMQRVSD